GHTIRRTRSGSASPRRGCLSFIEGELSTTRSMSRVVFVRGQAVKVVVQVVPAGELSSTSERCLQRRSTNPNPTNNRSFAQRTRRSQHRTCQRGDRENSVRCPSGLGNPSTEFPKAPTPLPLLSPYFPSPYLPSYLPSQVDSSATIPCCVRE